jgi:hypothetical protein
MPNAIQTIAGFFTAVGAGTSVATPAPGDLFTVPSFALTSKAYLEKCAVSGAQVDFIRIRSPRLHDANQGIRIRVGATLRRELLPFGLQEQMYPSDIPTIEIDATAAGSNGLVFSYAFDDLPGVAPLMDTWENIKPRILHLMGCEVSVTSGAIGAWGASSALNSSFDNFEAGANYAWLGYTVRTPCLGIAMTGKDTGNLKIGGPGSDDPLETHEYFVRWDRATPQPRIPIIQANNRAATILQNVDIAAATVSLVTLYLAQLSS